MNVSNVMSKKVITVRPEDTLETAVQKMAKHEFSSLPVVKEGSLVGIVTEADVIRAMQVFGPKIHFDTGTSFDVLIAVLRKGKEFENVKAHIMGSGKLKVKDFMKPHPWTVEPDDSVEQAARLMVQKGVKSLPVVKGCKLIGIIARADIVRALSS